MELQVNGKALAVDRPLSIKDLLLAAKADRPDYVTVQLNGEFVDHAGFEDTFVQAGDAVEFLYFMGGGAI